MTAAAVENLASPPAYIHIPPRDGSLVHAVTAVAAKVGRTLDPAQHQAVDVLTSSFRDGRPATLEAVVICPRQNLKTYCLELIVLTRLLRKGGDQLAVWSAHEVATAQETFRNILSLAEQHSWLERQVAHVSRATGREGIEFVGGKRLRFRARVKTGGRGLAGDLIVLDEAFALQPVHMGSLLPILSTRPRGQVIYGSSAPLAGSDVLRNVAQRARGGGKSAPAYIEWCAPGGFDKPGCQDPRCQHSPDTPGCVLDDEAMWIAANPAAAYGRISMEYLRSERLALSHTPEEHARERLGWWSEPDDPRAAPIPLAAWLARVDAESTILGRRVLSLDVAPDRRSAAIGGAGLRSDGTTHAALVDHRPGTSWAVRRLMDLVGRGDIAGIVLDGASPAAVFLPDLEAEGLTQRSARNPDGMIVVMGAADMAAACGGLQDAVSGDSPDLWHRGDPILTAALTGARRRDIGDGGWGWDRKRTGVDICPLVAVTEAVWGLSVLPVEPEYDLSASFA